MLLRAKALMLASSTTEMPCPESIAAEIEEAGTIATSLAQLVGKHLGVSSYWVAYNPTEQATDASYKEQNIKQSF